MRTDQLRRMMSAAPDRRIASYLEGREARWRTSFDRAVRRAGCDPRARILALFDTVAACAEDPGLQGCLTLTTAPLLSECGPAAQAAAAAHRFVLHARVADLLHTLEPDAARAREVAGALVELVTRCALDLAAHPEDSALVVAIARERARDLLPA